MTAKIRSIVPKQGQWIWRILVFLSGGYISTFLILAGIRLAYPYELEWIEGAMIDQMRWILQGRALYGPPDIHFIPFAYTPIFFYLSAGLMKWVGMGFHAPRLISILAACGSFLVIYQIVHKHTEKPTSAVIAVGIYAATFQLTGAWIDLAKVDSLFLFFLLLGFVFSHPADGKAWMVFAGFCFTLAYFTKQLALPMILAFAPISLWVYRGKTWYIWLTALLCIPCIVVIYDYLSGGWFSFYTIKTVFTHPRASGWLQFLQALTPKMWPAILISGFFAFLQFKKLSIFPKDESIQSTWNLIGFCAALILTSWTIYFKIWTYSNDLIPAAAGLAILCGLCSGNVLHSGRTSGSASLTSFIIPGLLLIQMALLFYFPPALLPTNKHYQKSEKIIQRIQSLPGEILNFNRGYWNYLSEKTTYLHITPLGDVAVARFPPGSEAAYRQKQVEILFEKSKSDQIFEWIITDKEPEGWLPNYLPVGNFIRLADIKYPGRDQSFIPKHLLKRNPIAQGGELPLDEPLFNDLFIAGWRDSISGSRVIIAPQARIKVAIEGNRPIDLRLSLQPICRGDDPITAGIEISWGDHQIGEMHFKGCAETSGEFPIPSEFIQRDVFNELVIDLTTQNNPAQGTNDNLPQLILHRLVFRPH